MIKNSFAKKCQEQHQHAEHKLGLQTPNSSTNIFGSILLCGGEEKISRDANTVLDKPDALYAAGSL